MRQQVHRTRKGGWGAAHRGESCKWGFYWPAQTCLLFEGLCTFPSNYCDIIHILWNLPIKSILYNGFQYIHHVVQLSPQSNFRIFSSYQKKKLKKNKVGGIGLFDFKNVYLTTWVKAVVLREKQTHRSIEQNREQRDGSTQVSLTEFWQIC